jgi:hypothetical protein
MEKAMSIKKTVLISLLVASFSSVVEAAPPPSQLGHFASPDGMVSLVVDRTGAQPKIKMDKESSVTQFFMEEARDKGNLVGHWLNGPDGKHWFYLGTSGEFYFVKPEVRKGVDLYSIGSVGVALRRDADAKALGAATKKGIASAAPEKTSQEKVVEQLQAISVLQKFPKFKPEDSGNLASVAQAFQSMEQSMLVRLSSQGAANAKWAPSSDLIGNTQQGLGGIIDGYPADQAWDKASNGLAKHGGIMLGRVEYSHPSQLRVHQLRGWPNPVLPGTPGIIWMVSSTKVVFVSLDGGRYTIETQNEGTPVEMGAGDLAKWPAPLQHTLIDIDAIRAFAKGAAIPDPTAQSFGTLSDAWWSCVNKVWEAGKKEEEKLHGKYEKLATLPKAYEAKATKECEPSKKALETELLSFIEARSKERLAVYEKAKARVLSFGKP